MSTSTEVATLTTSQQTLPNLLAECREIYRLAGVPVSPRHEQLALQLMISMEESIRCRIAERLPNYLKWALATGRWSDAAHTKSLINVLRDGDWDVELCMRDLPPPRKPTIAERTAAEYYQDVAMRSAKGNS